jgi:hypothetical protein
MQDAQATMQRIGTQLINTSSSPPPSPLPDPLGHTTTTPNGKVRWRSGFDILHSLAVVAGPDSNLPLPRCEPGSLSQDGIRKVVPMDFGVGPTSQSYKCQSSPTRTLSRRSPKGRIIGQLIRGRNDVDTIQGVL